MADFILNGIELVGLILLAFGLWCLFSNSVRPVDIGQPRAMIRQNDDGTWSVLFHGREYVADSKKQAKRYRRNIERQDPIWL